MALATASRIRAGEAYVRITTDNSALVRGLQNAKQHLRDFGQSLKGVGADMMQVAGAISLPLAFSAKEFADYDDKIRVLRAITGATATETNVLSTNIRNLGANTAFTASQVGQAAVELARMGFNAQEVQDGLRPILDLTRATGTDTFKLGEVASYAAAAMRGFGLSSQKFAQVCDVMGVAADNSAMDVADLGEALKIAAPSAKTINEDIRDTASALMLMANAGVRGSLAGTSLRKVYQSLAAQSGKTAGLTQEQIDEGIRGADELAQMGIRLVDQNGNLRKTNVIMAEIAKKARSLKNGEKINFATDIFDLRGSLGALSIMDKYSMLDTYRKMLDEADGFNKKVADDVEAGMGGAIRQIVSQLKELQIAIGDALFQTFGKARQKIVQFTSAMRTLIVCNKEFFAKLVIGIGSVFLFGAALFGLGAIIKILASTLGFAIGLIKLLGFVLVAPINAFILLKNVVIAAKAAMLAFGVALGVGEGAMAIFGGSMMTLTGIFLAFIGVWQMFPAVAEGFKNAIAGVYDFVKPSINGIKDTFLESFAIIKDALVSGDLSGAVKVLLASLKLEFALGLKPIKQLWIALKTNLSITWSELLYGIRISWASFKSWFQIGWLSLSHTISEIWDKVWGGVLLAMNRISWELKSVWRGIQKFFYSLMSEITGGDYTAEIKAVEQAENSDFTEYVKGQGRVENGRKQMEKEHAAEMQAARTAASNDIAAIMKEREQNMDVLEKKELEQFLLLDKQIDEYRKGYESAKDYAAMWAKMKKRAGEIEKYFEDVVHTYKVDANMQRIVESYKRALESGDEEKRDAAEAALIRAINRERNLARKTSDKFYASLEEAQSDRVITDEEDKELRALAKERAKHLKLQEQLENIMQTGVASTQAAISEDQKRNGIGGWSSDAVNAMLNNSESKRTADATESSAKTLLDIKRHLQNRKTTITYGS